MLKPLAMCRWLYNVEAQMAKCSTRLEIFVDRLEEFQQKLHFLDATKQAPKLYVRLLSECDRRRTFAQSFTKVSFLVGYFMAQFIGLNTLLFKVVIKM